MFFTLVIGFYFFGLVFGIGWGILYEILVLFFLYLLGYFLFGIAVFAPRASHFFSTAKKSNQKKPPLRLRSHKKHGSSHLKLALSCCARTHQHKKHVGSNSWRRKLMTTLILSGLPNVGEGQKKK
jgi:Na+-transporting methylmalonyl-CoA/oxaloacetate decarboxylase gamma subunit